MTSTWPLRSGLLCVLLLAASGQAWGQDPTILFVTQPPLGADFATVNATFGNHRGEPWYAPRGGDLYIRYGNGTLRNLTAAAGYGVTPGQEIAVRDPSVHWSGTKALFSMAVGGTTVNDYSPVYFQIYEVSGFGVGEVVQIRRLAQPADCNNVSPLYGTDDRILFSSDRPRNGVRTTYPQLDEYESTPTVTGLWSMNPDGSDLKLLDHAVSGDFTPIIASDGRVIFTRWDHLQRDQQSNEGTLDYGAFNYASESSNQALSTTLELFPELRVQPANSATHGHRFNFFFPWQMNEDGSGLETLNHVGRHELSSYFDSSRDGLPEFIADEGRRTADLLLQLKEDPNRPGYFYATRPPEFGTHAAGQIIALNGAPGVNADDMQVDYITHPATAFPISDGQTPPSGHSGLYRNALPLSDGTLLAVRTTSPYSDRPVSGILSSRYDFHLARLLPGSPYRTPSSPLIPGGISKSISYWDNGSYSQVQYSGRLWELDPAEVRARAVPARHHDPLPAIEMQILTEELGDVAGVDRLRTFLESNELALVVSRNVTRRADQQQDFNLKISGSSTSTAEPGATPVEISYLQFFQGDLIRGYSGFHEGRRVLAQHLHDGLNPELPDAPEGSVALGADGSMAALVPARRALSWQLVESDGTPVVRERYWVTFAPGEMRTCANCHGINRTDVVLNQPSPTNPPEALRDLARWWKATFDSSTTPAASRSPSNSPSPTPTPTVPPSATVTATRTTTRTATTTFTATGTRTSTQTRTTTPTPTTTVPPSATVTVTRTATRTATTTFTAPATRTTTQTQTPSGTFTPTGTSTPSITATATRRRGVHGRVHYFRSDRSVPGVEMRASGAGQVAGQTSENGEFHFSDLSPGSWTVEPIREGNWNDAISPLDAVYVLQILTGRRGMDANTLLACDVNGDGTLSAMDATRILQRQVGRLARFSVAQSCGSDWAFIPQPLEGSPRLISPAMTNGACQHGATAYEPLSGDWQGQDFVAVLFGDCTGNWQPAASPTPSGAVSQGQTPSVQLALRRSGPRRFRAVLTVDGTDSFHALSADIRFLAEQVRIRTVRAATAATLLEWKADESGLLKIALASDSAIDGSKRVVVIEGEQLGARARTRIEVVRASVDERPARTSKVIR